MLNLENDCQGKDKPFVKVKKRMLKLKNECYGGIKGVLNFKNKGSREKATNKLNFDRKNASY